jgi:hypothetical protein
MIANSDLSLPAHVRQPLGAQMRTHGFTDGTQNGLHPEKLHKKRTALDAKDTRAIEGAYGRSKKSGYR